jgi:hypothetical protein
LILPIVNLAASGPSEKRLRMPEIILPGPEPPPGNIVQPLPLGEAEGKVSSGRALPFRAPVGATSKPKSGRYFGAVDRERGERRQTGPIDAERLSNSTG